MKCVLNLYVLETYIKISYHLASLTFVAHQAANCHKEIIRRSAFHLPYCLQQREVEPHIVNWPVSVFSQFKWIAVPSLLCCGDIVRGNAFKSLILCTVK